ncbi:hypothetical protein HWV62_38220 [Athelia sp. TMB]|nr:hypothetical protein HWV62_38220 [Athelia sp. TMB]
MPGFGAGPSSRSSSHASTSTTYLDPSHPHSNALPPLYDLTGEIKKQSQSPDGGGGFADVHKALWGKENVAVKVLRWNLNDESDRLKKKKRLHREIRVWQRLEHRNILPLYGITRDFGPYPSMVCPWLEQGDLNKYLARNHDDLTLLHRFQFSNVLITAAGKPCLADFGLSKIMAEFEGTSYLTGTGGAVRWAAFELYHVYGDDDEPQPALISKQSDIYLFGSIILQMLSGKIPYYYIRAQAAVVILVHSGTLPRRPERVQGLSDDKVWGFINKCWSAPSQRPTIAEVSAFVHGYHARLGRPSNSYEEPALPDQDFSEEFADVPLVCDMSQMSVLRDEYGIKHPFTGQFNWLVDCGQDHIRRMRAVAFAFVEQILTQSGSMHLAVAHAVDILDSTRDLMDVAGFPPSMYEDLLVIYKSIVQQIVIPDINGEVMTPEILLEAFKSLVWKGHKMAVHSSPQMGCKWQRSGVRSFFPNDHHRG